MHLLQALFLDTKGRLYRLTDNFFALLTIISIVSLVLETVPSLGEYYLLFVVVEWVCVIFFTIEYFGRLSVSSPRWHYSLSFLGVVDLVAILPTYLGLGNFTFLKSARALRIIRMLRMLRLAKMSRRGIDDEDMSVLSLNVVIYFTTLTVALLFTGTVMYLIEPNTNTFSSIPSGMWWSFKVFLAGIPVTEPLTTLGEFFFVIIRFIGLLLLGLLIGVVGNIFRALLMGKVSKK